MLFRRFISFYILIGFFLTTLGPLPQAHGSTALTTGADTILSLPQPGTMVNLSPAYVPVIVKGLRVHPENPILFDFIVDTGNSGLSVHDPQLRVESEKLIKYFLASLTIPEDDLWVNLSPYEKDRIIPDPLGQTEMGRDMLAEDYMLKQITASLIYPEKNLGKEFWNRVYAKAQEQYGTNQIPVNTFNKVWIVADKAKVYVHANTAFVVASHLKVMLEEDYLALEKNRRQPGDMFPAKRGTCPRADLASQIVRQIILPELEHEVNYGQNFANLRQIFHSMILAAWYKKNLKQALLNQVYSNRDKISGIERPGVIAGSEATKQSQQNLSPEQIYQQYLKAYKKGVFNYIKEDIQNGQTIPRKYFSGGVLGVKQFDLAQTSDLSDRDVQSFTARHADGAMVNVSFETTEAEHQGFGETVVTERSKSRIDNLTAFMMSDWKVAGLISEDHKFKLREILQETTDTTVRKYIWYFLLRYLAEHSDNFTSPSDALIFVGQLPGMGGWLKLKGREILPKANSVKEDKTVKFLLSNLENLGKHMVLQEIPGIFDVKVLVDGVRNRIIFHDIAFIPNDTERLMGADQIQQVPNAAMLSLADGFVRIGKLSISVSKWYDRDNTEVQMSLAKVEFIRDGKKMAVRLLRPIRETPQETADAIRDYFKTTVEDTSDLQLDSIRDLAGSDFNKADNIDISINQKVAENPFYEPRLARAGFWFDRNFEVTVELVEGLGETKPVGFASSLHNNLIHPVSIAEAVQNPRRMLSLFVSPTKGSDGLKPRRYDIVFDPSNKVGPFVIRATPYDMAMKAAVQHDNVSIGQRVIDRMMEPQSESNERFSDSVVALRYLLQIHSTNTFMHDMLQLIKDGRIITPEGKTLSEDNTKVFKLGAYALDKVYQENKNRRKYFLKGLVPHVKGAISEVELWAGLLRKARKPSDISWLYVAMFYEIIWSLPSGFDRITFERIGSALDNLRRPYTILGESKDAENYLVMHQDEIIDLLDRVYFDHRSNPATLEGAVRTLFELAIQDHLPKSGETGPARFDIRHRRFSGLAPSTFIHYLPIIGYKLIVPQVDGWNRKHGFSMNEEWYNFWKGARNAVNISERCDVVNGVFDRSYRFEDNGYNPQRSYIGVGKGQETDEIWIKRNKYGELIFERKRDGKVIANVVWIRFGKRRQWVNMGEPSLWDFWKGRTQEVNIKKVLGWAGEQGLFPDNFHFEVNGFQPGRIAIGIGMGSKKDKIWLKRKMDDNHNVIFERRSNNIVTRDRTWSKTTRKYSLNFFIWEKKGSQLQASGGDERPGGIDLNARNMDLDVSGEKLDIRFDKATVAQFRRGDFSGVRPVIITITPIANVMPLLGLKQEDGGKLT